MKGHPLYLSAEEFMRKSREITGIDIIDHEAVEPLNLLVKAYNTEAELYDEGARVTEKELLGVLCNRLRMKRDFAAHPEIAEQKIKGPLLVYGIGRSGTTKTQKVLSVTGDFNWLPFWQVIDPSLISGDRNESPEPRIRHADEITQWFAKHSPEYVLAHVFETHEPEEDSFLGGHSLVAPIFWGFAEIPSYLELVAKQDMREYFKFIRDELKYLQWQGLASESKPWLLKCPLYVGMEPIFLEVFPDTRFVMTHRDPIQTAASNCRLMDTFREPFSALRINYNEFLAGFGVALKQNIANRKTMPDLKIMDLHFDKINQSSEAFMEKIYAFCGMPFTESVRQKIRDWDLKNPRHKRGAFKYSLADYKVSEEQVKQYYADYIAFMEQVFKA